MSDIINNDFFEAMLRQAVIVNNKNEIAAIPSDDELSKLYVFSERHNKRMKRLFAADSRREVFAIVYKWGRVAVIAVCISATLMLGALLTSAEMRKTIADVIVTWFGQFTNFHSAETSDEFIERDWSLSYLPEGFALHDTITAGEIENIIYENSNNDMIVFSYSPSHSSTSVDNEDMEYSIIIENDIVFHLFKPFPEDEYGENIIVWDLSGYRFTLTSGYELDELLKIAFSIK
jgi:hypothetical protein